MKSGDSDNENKSKTNSADGKEEEASADKTTNGAGADSPPQEASDGAKPKTGLLSDSMKSLSEYLSMHLGIREKPPSKLESMDLAGIAKFLASDECKHVVTMAGAGISTSAGIPDFRSPGSGLYDNLAAYDLPEPMAIFSIDFFRENPKPFFVLAKELYPGLFKPTPCHYFLTLLNKKGKLLRHYTQNIDTLERVAGLPDEKTIEAHGTFHTGHCLNCAKEYTQEWMKDEIFADKIPKCTDKDCEGVVKPDIVFFGEALPRRFAESVQSDLTKCDLLVVLGTSLQVQPFASLVSRVPMTTPRLYINLEKGMTTSNPITALMFGGGFEFDAEDNYRDVFKEATCDAGCQELADLLGWGDELREMIKSEHARIDKEKGKSPKKDTPSQGKAAANDMKSPGKSGDSKGGKKGKM